MLPGGRSCWGCCSRSLTVRSWDSPYATHWRRRRTVGGDECSRALRAGSCLIQRQPDRAGACPARALATARRWPSDARAYLTTAFRLSAHDRGEEAIDVARRFSTLFLTREAFAQSARYSACVQEPTVKLQSYFERHRAESRVLGTVALAIEGLTPPRWRLAGTRRRTRPLSTRTARASWCASISFTG